jgi:hypothetical protein
MKLEVEESGQTQVIHSSCRRKHQQPCLLRTCCKILKALRLKNPANETMDWLALKSNRTRLVVAPPSPNSMEHFSPIELEALP